MQGADERKRRRRGAPASIGKFTGAHTTTTQMVDGMVVREPAMADYLSASPVVPQDSQDDTARQTTRGSRRLIDDDRHDGETRCCFDFCGNSVSDAFDDDLSSQHLISSETCGEQSQVDGSRKQSQVTKHITHPPQLRREQSVFSNGAAACRRGAGASLRDKCFELYSPRPPRHRHCRCHHYHG